MCESPAQAVNNVWLPGVVSRVDTCVLEAAQRLAHFVFGPRNLCSGPAILKVALQRSNKAGMVSPIHRSSWPGTCAVAGGGNGR